jgi:hypothetical protein
MESAERIVEVQVAYKGGEFPGLGIGDTSGSTPVDLVKAGV